MPEPSRERTGGQILVDQLKIHGVSAAFCVPGESYLAALDALYDAADAIRLISCRHEGGASFMAAAHGKLTGRPGICLVTRGPGATNASIGVHTAFQDSAPMVLLVGQVERGHQEREAFQEIDFRRVFGQMAKWVAQVDDPARLPEMVAHAFQLAVSGRPGPVVLALPEDMLAERCEAADAAPYMRVQGAPGADQMERLRAMLEAAQRPLLIVGGGDWSPRAAGDLRSFCQANNLPAAAAFRAQDILDNRAEYYAGDLGTGPGSALLRRVREADLLLVVGDRLGEIVTRGFTLIDIPRPRQRFVHVYPEPSELGRLYQPDLPILSGMREFAAAARAMAPLDSTTWAEWMRAARADYLAHLRHAPVARGVDLGAVMAYLRESLPHDAIVANGAGNFTAWLQRFYQFSVYPAQLGPANGAMGYGLPAALAARVAYPDRVVVAVSGDGDFLMTGQELATAMHYGLAVVILVVNNGQYGTIRMHQERHYPGRPIGTALTNPDFVAYATAFGAYGETVAETDEFAPAFERALACGRPALLELRTDPELFAPG